MNKKSITISTIFTLLRIALTPCIIIAMIMHRWSLACGLFIFAAATDALDGFLARALHQETYLGSILDPLADKILLISCFAAIAFIDSPLFTIPPWFVLVILIKELFLIVGFGGLYIRSGAIAIRPTLLSKLTTVCQVLFIFWLFLCHFYNWVPIKTYYVMLGSLMTLILLTLMQYMVISYRFIFYGKI